MQKGADELRICRVVLLMFVRGVEGGGGRAVSMGPDDMRQTAWDRLCAVR